MLNKKKNIKSNQSNIVESYFIVLSFKGQTLQRQIFKGKNKEDVEKQFRRIYPKRGHVDITPM